MYEDLTGHRFNKWTVLEDAHRTTSDRDHYWLCKCDCGTVREVRGSSLKKGTSKSCGCIKKESSARANNLIGERFDHLVVIEKTDKRSCGSIVWKCRCDCGNECERSTVTLKKQRTHSCGCYEKELLKNLNKKDLIGKRFGKLIVTKETEERQFGNIVWECQCDCGNTVKVPTSSLTSGNTSSCGCINYSIGEKKIESLLKEANIKFKAQYSNPELKLKRFDFAILNDNDEVIRLIEFDGIQHYENVQGMWNMTETVSDIQQRDWLKNQWAKEHNIPLVRVPYWDRDNITLDLLLGEQYLVK